MGTIRLAKVEHQEVTQGGQHEVINSSAPAGQQTVGTMTPFSGGTQNPLFVDSVVSFQREGTKMSVKGGRLQAWKVNLGV